MSSWKDNSVCVHFWLDYSKDAHVAVYKGEEIGLFNRTLLCEPLGEVKFDRWKIEMVQKAQGEQENETM